MCKMLEINTPITHLQDPIHTPDTLEGNVTHND